MKFNIVVSHLAFHLLATMLVDSWLGGFANDMKNDWIEVKILNGLVLNFKTKLTFDQTDLVCAHPYKTGMICVTP